MFWGCISYYGVGTLTPVVDNLNSEKYINILDDNLWPVIAQHFPTSPYIFQVVILPLALKTTRKRLGRESYKLLI
jgi:hypothetical protein